MKKFIPFSFIALLIGAIPFFSFTNYTPSEALAKVKQQFKSGQEKLTASIEQYVQAVDKLDNTEASLEKLRQVHLETRLAFKRIEFLLEYFDRSGVKKFLNGPPLLYLEPKVPELRVLEPYGLQVLDEIVFGDDPYAEKENLKALASKLSTGTKEIIKYQSKIRLTHRHVFEAVRAELIRIMTLGVTGFDTPGSVNAIPEAREAITGIDKAMEAYLPLIKEKQIGYAFNIEGHFDVAYDILKKYNEFDTFDRMIFLQKAINPQYGFILEAQKLLGIETIEEVNDAPQATNYQSKNIFGNDFLNVDYFSNIHGVPDNLREKREELGKILFFDPVLSANLQQSCASCHQPDKAFTDGLVKSLSNDGQASVKRNSPSLVNSVYTKRWFWDLREHRLERQIKHVVLDKMEFDTDFTKIVKKLEQSKEYKKLFKDAYKDQPNYSLSSWSVSDALASYVASLASFNSPFDKYVREESYELDPAAIRGFNLFMGKAACGTCHFAPSFGGLVPPTYDESESEILGVPEDPDADPLVLDPDPGRAGNKRPSEEAKIYGYSFKTVTVRNAALTAPYMHNGAYPTLESVVDFYNKGGGAGMGLDVYNQTLPDAPLNLTEQEMKDLVVFMEALTDIEGMTDVPTKLPEFEDQPDWNTRTVGGTKY